MRPSFQIGSDQKIRTFDKCDHYCDMFHLFSLKVPLKFGLFRFSLSFSRSNIYYGDVQSKPLNVITVSTCQVTFAVVTSS